MMKSDIYELKSSYLQGYQDGLRDSRAKVEKAITSYLEDRQNSSEYISTGLGAVAEVGSKIYFTLSSDTGGVSVQNTPGK